MCTKNFRIKWVSAYFFCPFKKNAQLFCHDQYFQLANFGENFFNFFCAPPFVRQIGIFFKVFYFCKGEFLLMTHQPFIVVVEAALKRQSGFWGAHIFFLPIICIDLNPSYFRFRRRYPALHILHSKIDKCNYNENHQSKYEVKIIPYKNQERICYLF